MTLTCEKVNKSFIDSMQKSFRRTYRICINIDGKWSQVVLGLRQFIEEGDNIQPGAFQQTKACVCQQRKIFRWSQAENLFVYQVWHLPESLTCFILRLCLWYSLSMYLWNQHNIKQWHECLCFRHSCIIITICLCPSWIFNPKCNATADKIPKIDVV